MRSVSSIGVPKHAPIAVTSRRPWVDHWLETCMGFRIQITAANTDAEIDRLIAVLEELAERGALQSADPGLSWRVEPAV